MNKTVLFKEIDRLCDIRHSFAEMKQNYAMVSVREMSRDDQLNHMRKVNDDIFTYQNEVNSAINKILDIYKELPKDDPMYEDTSFLYGYIVNLESSKRF